MTQEAVEKADKSWKKNKKAKVWRKAVARYEAQPKNRAKIKAKDAVKYAVKTGKLKKPKACPKCGRSGVRIVFHHNSSSGDSAYKKENQLKGVFRCDKCHAKDDPRRSGARISAAVKRSLAKKKK